MRLWGHMYILRSYQGNQAQELIRYVRPPRWHKVMATKHYSGMASHWPVIWYQVCAPRTGQQKTSRLSQELQRSIDLASFTCLPVHLCGPRPTIFCFQPISCTDPGSVFHLAVMLRSFIPKPDSSSSCWSSFPALVWFVFLPLLFLSPLKKPLESSVPFHALLFCNPHGCVLCRHERVNTSNSYWNKRTCIHCGKATKAGRLYDKQQSWND